MSRYRRGIMALHGLAFVAWICGLEKEALCLFLTAFTVSIILVALDE